VFLRVPFVIYVCGGGYVYKLSLCVRMCVFSFCVMDMCELSVVGMWVLFLQVGVWVCVFVCGGSICVVCVFLFCFLFFAINHVACD
jgi:hypothetical protein